VSRHDQRLLDDSAPTSFSTPRTTAKPSPSGCWRASTSRSKIPPTNPRAKSRS